MLPPGILVTRIELRESATANQRHKTLGKLIQRLRGLLKLGAQNRAFPANPEKLCHLLRLNMSWYFASLPGFFENPGDPGFPVLKYLSQQASKTFRQCGHFLAQVADQAPPPVTEPVHTGPGVVYECLDACQGAEIAVG